MLLLPLLFGVFRHCEERSDEAIQLYLWLLDCFAWRKSAVADLSRGSQ